MISMMVTMMVAMTRALARTRHARHFDGLLACLTGKKRQFWTSLPVYTILAHFEPF